MAGRVFTCDICNGVVKLVEGQYLGDCAGCKARYYSPQQIPPAVVLKSNLNRDQAKDQVVQAFKHEEIAGHFRRHADFIDVQRYYVPIFEMRVTRAGWQGQVFSGDVVFDSHPEVQLVIANHLADLDLDTIDMSLLQEEVLQAVSTPFDPLKLRQSGIILSFTEPKLIAESDDVLDSDIIEKFYRLVYLPVWQVSFRYHGFVYKSYVSAVAGRIISLKALREYKKKLLYALLGLMSTAVFIGRGIVEGPLFAILSVAVGVPMLIFLTPYLWDMYAFREMVKIEGDTVTTQQISRVERSFVETAKLFSKKMLGKSHRGIC